MYDIIYNNLITNGYHLGKISEIFNDLTGIKEEDFEKWAIHFRNTATQKDKRYRYRHNFTAQNNPDVYLNVNEYSGPNPTEDEFLHEISSNDVQKRKDFINQVIAGGGNIRTTQQWYLLNLENFDGDDFSMKEMSNFYKNLFRQHTSLIYPELMEKKESFVVTEQFSLYEEGDFSEVHFDGINPGRACVIILYLADPDTYHDGDGGELFLGHNLGKDERGVHKFLEPYEKCIPVYGNYAIMDFTKFNVGHSIETVNNKFQRFAAQSFIGP
jgi:Rps23 Pro-64 3,4-dihydroxylase Tpa1-like proline 4-hydroxylase